LLYFWIIKLLKMRTPQQIGESQEVKLLREISKQLDRLIKLTWSIVNNTSTTTTTTTTII